MFLVLVVHADFWSNGIPTQEECLTKILPSLSRFFFEALSIVCVDVFVLISGWFGIRPNTKKMSSFIFQCFFFLGGLYLVSIFVGFGELNGQGILGCFGLLNWNWFIKAYIGLCIIAPILNKFISESTEKQLRIILIWFYIFQTIYGWLFSAAQFIEQGYSVFSFVGLYLLAQYTRKYCIEKINNVSTYKFVLIFTSIVILNTLWGYISILKGIPFFSCIFNYISPLVILASVTLLLLFQKIKFQNKIVNWIAASSFAVFLFHVAPATNMVFFKNTCIYIYNYFNGPTCIAGIFLFLTIVFCCAILLDQLRILVWRKLSGWVFKFR